MSARAASSISAPPVSWRQAVLPVTDGDNGTLPHEPHRKTAVSLDGDPETMLWPPMRRVSGRLSNAVRQKRKVWRDYSSRPRLSLLPSAEKGVVLMRRMSVELCNCRPKPGTVPEAVPSRDRVQRPRLNESITKRAGRSIAGGIFDGMSKLPHQKTDETQ